jgi:hypothetical protein
VAECVKHFERHVAASLRDAIKIVRGSEPSYLHERASLGQTRLRGGDNDCKHLPQVMECIRATLQLGLLLADPGFHKIIGLSESARHGLGKG